MDISNRHRRLLAALFAALASACSGDGPTGPQSGTLRVSAPTSGGDFDLDGYEIVVSGSDVRRMVFANGTADVRSVSAGVHTIWLEKLAPNCTVTSTYPLMVNVKAGQTIEVAFEVVCAVTGIAVTTRTTGVDTPDSYQVIVAGRPSVSIQMNGSVLVSRLEPGSYTVALVTFGNNCSVAGGSEVTVDVSARSVTPLLFDVTCARAIRPEKIAFAVDTFVGGSNERWIALINPDGSGMTKLVPGDSPAWSPDGTRFVYSTTQCITDYYYDENCAGGLVMMDPEIGKLTTLLGGDGGFTPTWGPTGDVIAFSRWNGVGLWPDRLYTLGLSASAPVELRPAVNALTDPDWSPDGRRIAFACGFGQVISLSDSSWDVCVANSDGTGQVRLTTDVAPEFGPAWSPDGTRIAFSRNAAIFVVTLGDSTMTRLTEGTDPSWSRDGTKLVFAGYDGLFIIDADGSNRTRLTTGPHHAPVWRPTR